MAPTPSLFSCLALAGAAVLLAVPAARASPRGPPSDQVIGMPIRNADVDPSRLVSQAYIVVYDETFPDDAISAHQASVKGMMAAAGQRRARRGLDGGGSAATELRIGSWRALHVQGASDRTMLQINDAAEVKFIEQDAVVEHRATDVERQAPSGLARISHAAAANGSAAAMTYVYDRSGGDGITAFVVDTGIMLNHSEFEGRATWGANFINTVVRVSRSLCIGAS